MSVWSFNKGEWTEAYVFLKLLGVGRLYGATKELKRDDNVFIDVCEILRNEKEKVLIFRRLIEEKISKVSIVDDNVQIKIIASSEFDDMATFLYNQLISKKKGNKGSDSIIEVQRFFESLYLSSPKPVLSDEFKERYGKKTDIIINYVDSLDHITATEGFSIKSFLGESPTLFNYSIGSKLIYEIEGCSDDKMIYLNAIDEAKVLFRTIREDSSLSLNFIRGGTDTFETNMSYCDTNMMKFLSTLLLINIGYIGNVQSSKYDELIDELMLINPLNLSIPSDPQKLYIPKNIYISIIRRLLFKSFCGLTASEEYDGKSMLRGGFIDVNKNGEILYYRVVSEDIFLNYLYANTKIDLPQRGYVRENYHQMALMTLNGKTEDEIKEYFNLQKQKESEKNKKLTKKKYKSKKGDWGYVYKENDKYFIALNFQIRFK